MSSATLSRLPQPIKNGNNRKLEVGGRKVLLLDLDGVVFQHREALKLIGKSVDKFVGESLNTSNGAAINKSLYQKYGHTLLGLNEVYKLGITLQEFNNGVYTDEVLRNVKSLDIPIHTELKAADARVTVEYGNKHGYRTYIFTNSPDIWVHYALSVTGLTSQFDNNAIISAETVGEHLKPQLSIYRIVEKMVGTDDISFVDDSPININNAPTHWESYIYDPGMYNEGKFTFKFFRNCTVINCLTNIIDTM